MQTFIEKFNESTGYEFVELRLRKAQYIIEESTLVLTFAYPEAMEQLIYDSREKIKNAAKRVLDGDIPNIEIKLVKSHFDRSFFLKDLNAFLGQFPMLYTMLSDDRIITENKDDCLTVTFLLDAAMADYCNHKSAGDKITEYIKNTYCGRVDVRFVNDDEEDDETDFEQQMEEAKGRFSLDNLETGRTIQPENVEEFIGKIIYDKAAYIEDAHASDESVFCGQVVNLKELIKKDGSKKFYKFVLKDYTGEIDCLYFPTKKTENQITLLVEGKEIVAVGKVKADETRDGKLTFWPNRISFCTLAKDFKINRLRRQVDDEYHVVFPEPYTVMKQSTLFDIAEPTHPFLIGKTFCVFDVETTGFAPENDRMIEIGAVRIVDGKIVDTFNTYIDPKRPIPEKIIALTGIKDSDVIGKPTIDEVMPDFFKYTAGTILVGQNVQFDYGFISVNGAKQNIYFENEMMDTIVLAKKYVPTLRKYNLGNLTKHFQVENISAHRGIYDAIATAEVFLKLIKMMT